MRGMVRREWNMTEKDGKHVPVGLHCTAMLSIDSKTQSVAAANWSCGSSREMVKQSDAETL
jgi:hypothetical protein